MLPAVKTGLESHPKKWGEDAAVGAELQCSKEDLPVSQVQDLTPGWIPVLANLAGFSFLSRA
nr:hypothetical protein DOP62_12590 [Synechococcus elongatus PCC 11801]